MSSAMITMMLGRGASSGVASPARPRRREVHSAEEMEIICRE
jgi:hypothetical protein